MNDKIAEKENLQNLIKYYEKRLLDLHKEIRTKQVYDCESSDSDDDTFKLANSGPPISQLKSEQFSKQTCLQATQELTSVVVLQAEVEFVTQEPRYDDGPKIKEQGVWNEVTAECRVDLVPFSINFYIHKANRKFAPKLYRGLKVLPVKKAQEIELSKSVLPDVTKPSDAVEVLKSYAKAYRARRTTLSRLADKFATELHLEPLAEGGYLLKCGSVLELSWRLENKWSPLSPFHHKMKFDLDYMDESHLKIITQAHRKLADPNIDTDQRTILLTKIISTCLELKAQHDESLESETESKKLEKTVLEDNSEEHHMDSHENQEKVPQNQDNDPHKAKNHTKNRENDPQNHKGYPKNKETDSKNREKVSKNKENLPQNDGKEIMAPPKTLPKKTKPKSKENTVDNSKAVKKAAEDTSYGVKKANVGDKQQITPENQEKVSKNKENVPKSDGKEIKEPPKTLPKKTKPELKENTTDNRKSVKRTAEDISNGVKKAKVSGKVNQNVASAQKELVTPKVVSLNENNHPERTTNKKIQDNNQNDPKKLKAAKSNTKNTGNGDKTNINPKKTPPNSNNAKTAEKQTKNDKNTQKVIEKHPKNTDHNRNPSLKSKTIEKQMNKNTEKKLLNKENTEKELEKNEKSNKNSNTNSTKIIKNPTQTKSTKNVINTKKIVEKTKLLIKSHKNTPKVKNNGNTDSVKDGKISKIPKFNSNSETNLKNVLRISPRKLPTKLKSPSDTKLLDKMKIIHTNIPMLKKPAPKI